MQKLMIIAGAVLVLVGLLWPWLSTLPFAKLPGDIVVDKPGFKFFFPLTTSIIISVVLSLLLWWFRK